MIWNKYLKCLTQRSVVGCCSLGHLRSVPVTNIQHLKRENILSCEDVWINDLCIGSLCRGLELAGSLRRVCNTAWRLLDNHIPLFILGSICSQVDTRCTVTCLLIKSIKILRHSFSILDFCYTIDKSIARQLINMQTCSYFVIYMYVYVMYNENNNWMLLLCKWL